MIVNTAQQIHGEREIDLAIEAVRSGRWAEGRFAQKFRGSLSEYLGIPYVELTNSGSSANFAALLALKTDFIPKERRLRDGDEVITTALSFPTTVSPIILAGAVPVFVDIEDNYYNADPRLVRNAITDKTKAIILAHNLGMPFNVAEIKKICDEYNLTLIEDNCDALGAEFDGKKTGTMGDIGTSSFYPAHHISTGEGGAIYCRSPEYANAIFSVINWGRSCTCRPFQDNTCGHRYDGQFGDLPRGYDHKNVYSELGINVKMTDIQAAIGLAQLEGVRGFVEKRRINNFMLGSIFCKYPYFRLPSIYKGATPSPFGFVVDIAKNARFSKSQLEQYFDKCGIKSRAFFGGNIVRQPLFSGGKYKYIVSGSLDNCDRVMNDVFWIGCHPAMETEELNYIENTLFNFLSSFYEL